MLVEGDGLEAPQKSLFYKANYTIIDQINSTVTHFQKNKCYVSPKQHTSQFKEQMCDYIDKQNHLYIANKHRRFPTNLSIEEIAIPTSEDLLKTYRFNQNNVSRSSNRTNLKVNSPEISLDQFTINSPEISRDQFTINKENNQRRQQPHQSSQPFNKATQRELGNNNKATYQQRKERQQYRRRSLNRANQNINSQEFFSGTTCQKQSDPSTVQTTVQMFLSRTNQKTHNQERTIHKQPNQYAQVFKQREHPRKQKNADNV